MSNNDPNQAKTRAAAYILLIKDNKTPLILRSNTGYRDNEWALPSGKVDHNEPFTVAAIREAKEEVGVDIDLSDLSYVLTLHRKSDNDPNEAWVDVLFVCNKWSGELINAEPEKHSKLEWFGLESLPDSLMDYQRALISAYKDNKNYVEFGWNILDSSKISSIPGSLSSSIANFSDVSIPIGIPPSQKIDSKSPKAEPDNLRILNKSSKDDYDAR